MTTPDPIARLPQVRPEDFTDEVRSVFDIWSGPYTGGTLSNSDKSPVLLTFAQHPALAKVFSPFNIHLLATSTLPVRQRQIAIMRTAWICKATYMWSSHLQTSQDCGVEPAIFGPIKVGADDPYFTDFERTVIRATEDVVRDKRISDANWDALTAEWDNRQMMDFLFTVGCYVLLAGVMRSTGIERQPALLELAEQYGAP